jgi:hypothetical protein
MVDAIDETRCMRKSRRQGSRQARQYQAREIAHLGDATVGGGPQTTAVSAIGKREKNWETIGGKPFGSFN